MSDDSISNIIVRVQENEWGRSREIEGSGDEKDTKTIHCTAASSNKRYYLKGRLEVYTTAIRSIFRRKYLLLPVIRVFLPQPPFSFFLSFFFFFLSRLRRNWKHCEWQIGYYLLISYFHMLLGPYIQFYDV